MLPTTTPTSLSTLDDYLMHLAGQNQLTGAVLIAQNGRVLVNRGFGYADAAQQIPNTAETRFRIGSITKQFTAMAILLLHDQGKLAITDRLCSYIVDCPPAWQPITLQQLLTHSSGIPDYTNFPDFPAQIGTPATPSELIARFKDRPLDFAPGSRWSYSNSGYILLGYIIEKITGTSYATFLHDQIFAPLHMAATGYDTNTPPLPEHATGYLDSSTKPVYLDMSEFFAAGALYSTVGDLYLWDQALQAGKLVQRADLDAMFTPHIPCPSGGCALSTDKGYGYGWFIADLDEQPYYYHWGRIDGFKSSNGFYPQSCVSVIILSNLETTDVFGLSGSLGGMAMNVTEQRACAAQKA